VSAIATTVDCGTSLLDHAGVEALVPHRGSMCLLDRLLAWSDSRIECTATDHRDAAHPLRTASGLLASAAIEYAAQAAALHGALLAKRAGAKASPGMLASARDVRLSRWRLDDLAPADPDALHIAAERQAGDGGRLLYAFSVAHGGRVIASGRLAVVLDIPRETP
jgi:predicted hotdog family 3-hydroxylacyl-ACP dehydratase